MKIWCIVIVLVLMIPIANAQIGVERDEFLVETAALKRAVTSADFSSIFFEYFMPSLNDNLLGLLLFGAELNLSNGRIEHHNGERHMFGKLESAESVVTKGVDDPNFNVDVVYEEVYRLLFGDWYAGGKTIITVVHAHEGKELSLITGKWTKYEGDFALRLEHTTEFFGNKRVRYLTFQHWEYDTQYTLCKITILR